MAFNQLTDGQAERLAHLMEELAESVQAAAKVLRHGYASRHPDGGPSNRTMLETELGQVISILNDMSKREDLDFAEIMHSASVHAERLETYYHHQGPRDHELDAKAG